MKPVEKEGEETAGGARGGGHQVAALMASQKECIIFPAGLKCKLCGSNTQLACYNVSGLQIGPAADPQLLLH